MCVYVCAGVHAYPTVRMEGVEKKEGGVEKKRALKAILSF